MLHKWEAMTGLPEDSLAHEKEARKEMDYYKSVKERSTKNKGEKK